MSKIDKIKEQIGWLKVVFGILSAIDVSLVGWLVSNYDKTDISGVKIYLGSAIAVVIAFVIVYIKGTSKNPKLPQHYSKSAYLRRNFAVATGSFKKFQRRRSAFAIMPYGSLK